MKKIMLLTIFVFAALLLACDAATTTRFVHDGCLVIENPGNVVVFRSDPTFADFALERVRFRVADEGRLDAIGRTYAIRIDPDAVRGSAAAIVAAAVAHPLPEVDTVFGDGDWDVELTYALGHGMFPLRIRVYTLDHEHFTVAIADTLLTSSDSPTFAFLQYSGDLGAAIYAMVEAGFAEQYPMY